MRDIIADLQTLDIAGHLEFTRLTCALIRNMRLLRKPVVASLNGTVAGAGACIALASDIRLASEEARIAFLFVRVGLSGADMGACFLLPRYVGLGRATELLYTGDFIPAQEPSASASTTASSRRALSPTRRTRSRSGSRAAPPSRSP